VQHLRAVAFRVDASSDIGGGHAMRCLTLAQALRARGAEPHFFVNPAFAATVPAAAEAGFPLHVVEGGADFAAALGATLGDGVDLAIFDHYGLAKADQIKVRGHARHVAVIDDLANRAHDADLLLDQTVGRLARSYAGLVPSHCRMLVGPLYALLRPEFAAMRPASLARRAHVMRRGRLLVSMGLTDVGGITGELVTRLSRQTFPERIDVLLADSAPSSPVVAAVAARDPRVRVYSPLEADVARLMTEADIAIGSAGTTSWERCCLGLPSIIIALASNQALVIAELPARGAALLAESPDEAVAQCEALARDGELYGRLAGRSADLVDGLGADRVADALMALSQAEAEGSPPR
jgi:UDP-2,4-diacetamido-2,4,6-trideoxy-beta-L-altropyranose hydrolase